MYEIVQMINLCLPSPKMAFLTVSVWTKKNILEHSFEIYQSILYFHKQSRKRMVNTLLMV